MAVVLLSKAREEEVYYRARLCRGTFEVMIEPRSRFEPSEQYKEWKCASSPDPFRVMIRGKHDNENFDPLFIFRVCDKLHNFRARFFSVKELNLSGTRIGDVNFMQLVECCQQTLPKLNVLNASYCDLTDVSLSVLGKSLYNRHFRQLQVLDFSGNKKMSDIGAKHFFFFLWRGVENLHSLSLARTSVKSFFVEPDVKKALRESNLERLDLRGCLGVEMPSVVNFLQHVVGKTKLTAFLPGLNVALDALSYLNHNSNFFETNKNLAVLHMPGKETYFEFGLDEYLRLKCVNQGLKMNAIVPLNRVRVFLSSRFFRANIYRPVSGGRFQAMIVAFFLCNGVLGWGVRLGEEVVRFILSFLKMGDW